MLVGSLYLHTGLALGPANCQLLLEHGQHLTAAGCQLILGADWQVALDELVSFGWPRQLGATVYGPQGTTCTAAYGRSRLSLAHRVVGCSVLEQGLVRPHAPARLTLRAMARRVSRLSNYGCAPFATSLSGATRESRVS